MRALRPSLDGRRLVTIPSSTGKPIAPVLWDLERYQPIAQLGGHTQVWAARFIAGGEVLTAGTDGARRWDGVTGQLHQTYRGSSRFLADVLLDPTGSVVVGGDADGILRFWEMSSGKLLWTLPAHKSYVVGIHFEGDDIVTRGFGGDLARWSLPKPEQIIAACDACNAPIPARDTGPAPR
jgi:WD40 repeat protein